MTDVDGHPEERNGANYDVAQMMEARRRTRQAIHLIADQVRPGMVEEDACAMAREILKGEELLRGWHGVFVRFGMNTVKFYGQSSEPGLRLGDDDIFIVDIGPVWRKWEADAGDTFVVGHDPDMLRAKQDVRTLFDIVSKKWREERATGVALYEFAETEARRMGWKLNLDLGGHRLSDFPHSLIHKGELKDVQFTPSENLWVLEMHIRHPVRPFGAFFEDLLIS